MNTARLMRTPEQQREIEALLIRFEFLQVVREARKLAAARLKDQLCINLDSGRLDRFLKTGEWPS